MARWPLSCFVAMTLMSAGIGPRVPPTVDLVDHSIVVMGDGYTATEQYRLNLARQRLAYDALLKHDSVYSRFSSQIRIDTVDVESQHSGIARPGQQPTSALKLVFTGDRNDCYFKVSEAAWDAIAMKAAEKPARTAFVIANVEKRSLGCARGDALFITNDADWEVAVHEYGHHSGLMDEYFDLPGPPAKYPTVQTNCAKDANTVWWAPLMKTHPGVGVYEGCGRHTKKIYRPAKLCRMNQTASNFCPVCESLVVAAFPQTASPSPAPPTTYVQMNLRIRGNEAPRVLSAREYNGSIQARTRAISRYLYAFLSSIGGDESVIFAEALPFDPREARVYGGTAPNAHTAQPAESTMITVRVPNRTLPQLRETPLVFELLELREGIAPERIDAQSVALLRTQNSVVRRLRVENLQTQISAVAIR